LLKEIKLNKKVPRLLLAHAEEYFEAIPGVEVLWPDRTYSPVFDLSLSGFAVDASTQLGSLKPEQTMELRLKLPTLAETIPFRVRLVRLKTRYAGFVFENLGLENRLTLEQTLKDQIVADSVKEIPTSQLPQGLSGNIWLHGAFDTNIILTFDPGRLEIENALVESDNLIWKYDFGAVTLHKTLPTTDEAQTYFSPEELGTAAGGRKVSMGASWMGRLIRVLETVNERRGGDLAGLLVLLRTQRAH
jgi:hypothetical protein